jgi:hypothetical protein
MTLLGFAVLLFIVARAMRGAYVTVEIERHYYVEPAPAPARNVRDACGCGSIVIDADPQRHRANVRH